MKSMGRRIRRLRERDGDNCQICGTPIDFTRPAGTRLGPSVDHKIPRAAGGHSNLTNLQLAHAFPCNHSKGAKMDGTDYAKLSDPAQTPEAIAAAQARRGARRQRLLDTPLDHGGRFFDSWSAARL